jgi:ABC-2 type transport system ATP-binding protein
MIPGAPAVETTSLTVRYGEARGIDDVDLLVEPGEVFGFLGPNGAGKTTTIRTLLDLLRPTGGSATVLGFDSHRDSIEVRRRVGYLSGDLELYERLDGRNLLEWLGRLRGGVDRALLDSLVDRFSVQLDRPIKQLSRGNRQKISLVQAFMHRPELLILDEPTSGLDPLMQDEFLGLVRETVEEGRTVFLSSHDLDEVQRAADRVGIIREGRLIAVDHIDALRRQAVRKMELTFARPVTSSEFEDLDGVRDVTVDGNIVRLAIAGPPDQVVKVAAHHELVDLLSEPADLDEIFLDYYRGAP